MMLSVLLAAFVIAERGGTGASIIESNSGDAAEKYAAEELVNWTEKLVGVNLKLAEKNGSKIVLKHTEEYGVEGFRLKAEGDTLYVMGQGAGMLYGVYELLEHHGGIAWLSSRFTDVPKADVFEVPSNLDDTQKPCFQLREDYFYDAFEPAFAARLRVNTPKTKTEPKYGKAPYRFGKGLGNCHTFAKLVPMSEYGESHPEYYSERNGVRLNKGKDPQRTNQLCLTNPEVVDIVTEKVLAAIEADPEAKYFGVSQNDNTLYCECAKCKAVDDEEGSHAGTLVRFINQIAERVEKKYPDKIIETLAYQYTREPPKKTRLRHNVMPCFCTIECDFSHSLAKGNYKQNVKLREEIKGWKAMTDKLYVWDYVTDFSDFLVPMPNVTVLRSNIRFFRDMGTISLFEQGCHLGSHADFAELKAWLIAKWMWNPDLPAGPLVDRFFEGYYGKAAKYVKQYFRELHAQDCYQEKVDENVCPVYTTAEKCPLSDEFLAKAAELWSKAEQAVAGDAERLYNVRMGAMTVDFVRFIRANAQMGKKSFHVRRQPFTEKERPEEIARRLLARRIDDPKIVYVEARTDNERRLNQITEAASNSTVTRFSPSDKGRIAVHDMSLGKLGEWCTMAQDPAADTYDVVKLANDHTQWCVQKQLSGASFDKGATYMVRVNAKVVKGAGNTGAIAFGAGVYDSLAGKNVAKIEIKASEVRDNDWHWYDIGKVEFGTGKMFWAAPGEWKRTISKGNPDVEAVYLDVVEIARIEDGGDAVAKFDKAMAGGAQVDTNGVKWVDGRMLPMEGKSFDNTDTFYERLPSNLSTNINQGLHSMKRHTAGMQFRFKTDSDFIILKYKNYDPSRGFYHMSELGVSGLDVYRFDEKRGKWRFAASTHQAKDNPTRPGEKVRRIKWTPGEECVINLPLYNGIEYFELGIAPGAKIEKLAPRKSGVEKPVVFYGTSIDHGCSASRPGLAFVNIVGRQLDVPVVDLGFSGSGIMEFDMSEVLAQIDASCYVINCLWNMDYKPKGRKGRVVTENYEPFLRNLRAKRPGVPIVLGGRANVFGEISDSEKYVGELCKKLQKEGWKDIYFVPTAELYADDGEGTVDGCHPNDWGMMYSAKGFGGAVKSALGLR